MSMETPLSQRREAINGYVTAYNNLVRTIDAPAPELPPMSSPTIESAQEFREEVKSCWDAVLDEALENYAEAVVSDELHEVGGEVESYEELNGEEEWDALDVARVDKDRLCQTLQKIDSLTVTMIENDAY